jgi:hypothetical protein
MLQILKARDYYGTRNGRTSSGAVLLRNGQPYHFPGREGHKDAKAAMARIFALRSEKCGVS